MSSTSLARSLEAIWYGDSAIAIALLPFSLPYAAVVAIRRACYRAGLIAVEQLGIPVIVVGNITAGGTGKTPLVEWLANELQRRGHRPGIVSRGYGGRRQAGPMMVTAETSAQLAGDEPVMLARRTGLPVCVCSDRTAAARRLLEAGATIILADDGLQHYRLHRDLEIAVLDSQRLLGNGWLLPAGPLREPAARLREVDLLMVNGDLEPARGYGFRLQASDPVRLGGTESQPMTVFGRGPVWVVAGIGNPQRFIQELEAAGLEVHPVAVPDHGRVDLAGLRTRHDWPVLMTEKDAVKYCDESIENAWFVPVTAQLSPAAEKALTSALDRLFDEPGVAWMTGD